MYHRRQINSGRELSTKEISEILLMFSGIVKEFKAVVRYERRKQSEKLRDEWIGGERVMNLLGIQRGTLQNLRDKGILPFSQVSSKFYYKVSDIEKLLESNYTRRMKNQKVKFN